MLSAIERKRTQILDGHRNRHARRLWQGQVTAGDGPDTKGKMGARCNNLRTNKEKQQFQSGTRGRGLQLKSA